MTDNGLGSGCALSQATGGGKGCAESAYSVEAWKTADLPVVECHVELAKLHAVVDGLAIDKTSDISGYGPGNRFQSVIQCFTHDHAKHNTTKAYTDNSGHRHACDSSTHQSFAFSAKFKKVHALSGAFCVSDSSLSRLHRPSWNVVGCRRPNHSLLMPASAKMSRILCFPSHACWHV